MTKNVQEEKKEKIDTCVPCKEYSQTRHKPSTKNGLHKHLHTDPTQKNMEMKFDIGAYEAFVQVFIKVL